MSNKDDNWVIYVVLPVPILGTYYTMYPIFWQIQNRGSRVIYQRPLVMFWQGRWQGRNWSISGTAWSSGVCKIWITVTSCCYCGMKNTPALYILFWNCYHQLFYEIITYLIWWNYFFKNQSHDDNPLFLRESISRKKFHFILLALCSHFRSKIAIMGFWSKSDKIASVNVAAINLAPLKFLPFKHK